MIPDRGSDIQCQNRLLHLVRPLNPSTKNIFVTVKRSLLLNVKPRRYEVPQYADRVKQVLKEINTVNFLVAKASRR